MTLWIHDPDANPTLSRREAVLNYELFAPGVAKPGDIAEVRLLPGNNVGDESGGVGIGGENMERKRSVSKSNAGDETEKQGPTAGKGKDRTEKRFLFVIRKMVPEQRARPGFQVCVGLEWVIVANRSRSLLRVMLRIYLGSLLGLLWWFLSCVSFTDCHSGYYSNAIFRSINHFMKLLMLKSTSAINTYPAAICGACRPPS